MPNNSRSSFLQSLASRFLGRAQPRPPETRGSQGFTGELARALQELGIMSELKKSLETFNEGTCAFCGNYLQKTGPRDREAEEYLRRAGLSPITMGNPQNQDRPEKKDIELYVCPYCGKHTGLGFGSSDSGVIARAPSAPPPQPAATTKRASSLASSTSPTTDLTKCVVPQNIVGIVQDLSMGRTRGLNMYAVWSLSLLIDALVLFDKIVIYDYNATAAIPLPSQVRQGSLVVALQTAGCIEFADPYLGQPVLDQIRSIANSSHGFETIDGGLELPGIARCSLDILARNETWLHQPNRDVIDASLDTINALDYPDTLKPKERPRFMQHYAGNKVWQIETGRHVRESANAGHLMIQPNWRSFWQHEREVIFEAAQQQRNHTTNIELVRRLGLDPLMTFPSFMAAVLDRMKGAADLAQATLSLRREMSALRESSKEYQQVLQGAITQLDVTEAIQQWRAGAVSALAETADLQGALTRQIFGWDLIKVGPLKDVLIGSQQVMAGQEENIMVLCGWALTGPFDHQITGPSASRLGRLFGELK